MLKEKAVATLVLLQAIGAMGEGEVIHVDEAAAEGLIEAGVARPADVEDMQDEPDGDEAEPEADEAPVMNSVRRLETKAKDALVKATARAIESQKQLAPRPAFGKVPAQPKDNKNGFKSFGEFAACVASAELGSLSASRKLFDSNRAVNKGQMSEGTAADGGALVPQEWANELFVRAYNDNPILSQCTRYPMKTNVLNIPVMNEASGSSGIVAYWIDEANSITDSKGVFNTQTLTLQKFAVLVNVTEELLQDNQYALESFLRMWVPKKITFGLNDAILNGGGNQANIVNAAGTIEVTRDTTGRILFNDVVNIYTRFYQENLGSAAWYVNPSAYTEIMKLAFPGASGTTPLFIPISGFGMASLAQQPAGTLLGRPVYLIEQMKALGIHGDIMLADFSQCAAGFRELDSASTIALYFDKYISSFRFVLRVDTASLWLQPYTRKDGVTSSPFVTLSGTTSSA